MNELTNLIQEDGKHTFRQARAQSNKVTIKDGSRGQIYHLKDMKCLELVSNIFI